MKTYHLIIGACWYSVQAKTLAEAKQKALNDRNVYPSSYGIKWDTKGVRSKRNPSQTFLERSTKLA